MITHAKRNKNTHESEQKQKKIEKMNETNKKYL